MRFIVKTFGDLDEILDHPILAQAWEMGKARLKKYGDDVYFVVS